MLKNVVLLVGVVAVLAVSNDAQARGFRRSRGSCPNGQCYAAVPATPATGGGAAVEASPAVEAPADETPVPPAVDAAVIQDGSNVSVSYRATNVRFGRAAFRGRYFRRW